jgi:transcriptional antiterminator NusG
MEKKWYVVHTKTGFELKAKEAIEERIKNEPKLADYIGEVIVPIENVVEVVKGKKVKKTKRVFPGYILVNMIVTDKTWHFIKEIPFITGFVGKKLKPMPLTEEEANRLITSYKEGRLTAQPLMSFEVGDNVRLIDGPFVNFNGTVDEVNNDKAKLKVLVSIFGRPTPVEVDFEQVEKI